MQKRDRMRWGTVVLGGLLAACGGGPAEMPTPRPLVVTSGARLTADNERLQEIYGWVIRADEQISLDPSFWIAYEPVPVAAFPWETMEFLEEDSVRIGYESSAPDVQTSYGIYAFLHLMDRMERMEEWFPEAAELEGYELEKFIVERTAESWLLGRTVFDTHPYGLLDEVIYAQDRGYFDEFFAMARGEDFPEELEEFREENPGRLEAYREWFVDTFDHEPPGYRPD